MKEKIGDVTSAESETARTIESEFQDVINEMNEISRKDGYDVVSALYGTDKDGSGPAEHSKWGNIVKKLAKIQKYLQEKDREEG